MAPWCVIDESRVLVLALYQDWHLFPLIRGMISDWSELPNTKRKGKGFKTRGDASGLDQMTVLGKHELHHRQPITSCWCWVYGVDPI